MRPFLFIYTLAMITFSIFTLGMAPRTLRGVGHERQRLKESAPDASFERLVEVGYRLNTLLLLIEILYYFLLLRFLSSHALAKYAAFAFGVVHISYLITGRWEKRRLSSGKTRTKGARRLIMLTAVLTVFEIVFLGYAGVLLLAS